MQPLSRRYGRSNVHVRMNKLKTLIFTQNKNKKHISCKNWNRIFFSNAKTNVYWIESQRIEQLQRSGMLSSVLELRKLFMDLFALSISKIMISKEKTKPDWNRTQFQKLQLNHRIILFKMTILLYRMKFWKRMTNF